MDIVTVIHNETNRAQAEQLEAQLAQHADDQYTFTVVDNRVVNRGFGPACNLGAKEGSARTIGFLNPDLTVIGPFMATVENMFDRNPELVITGERFGKDQHELAQWGVQTWVCGACLMVRRAFFEKVGGFDPAYIWGWEETDLIRQAVRMGLSVRSISLPVMHSSPTVNTPEDAAYKNLHFENGARYYRQKWGRQ